MDYRFLTVDVFASKRFEGAQISVVPDADSLTSFDMQQIAAEFNLWRTVFITGRDQDDADYSIRIFSPNKEYDFGGHATIAAIYALAELQLIPLKEGKNKFILNERSGNVTCIVELKHGQIHFNQYCLTGTIEVDSFTPPLNELAQILSIDESSLHVDAFKPLIVATHVPYLFLPVVNAASLSDVNFDYKSWAASTLPSTLASSIFLFSESTDKEHAHFHCRLVGPNYAVHEDPPIGAAMSAFCGYLSQFSLGKQVPVKFIAERGIHAGRKSIVHAELVNVSGNTIELRVGGTALPVFEGKIHL